MVTEVVVDRNLWTLDGSESVLRAWLHGRIFDLRVNEPSFWPALIIFYFSFFSFLFLFNLKLPIMHF